ncbi:GTP cyclohydrolase 1 type 2/Nif3 [Aspergillus ambiguus]|uniref:Nif3-like dinuclear metal center hexameric protein n=1 Tax=Aspergillus ambiguus TaxID=176160 RepID=UPI003CCE2F53
MSSLPPASSSPFTRAVVSSMRKLYPESLAEKSFDNTGLLLEAPYNPSQKQNNSVLLTIDLTKAVADEAIARKDSIVIAYHPIIFRGLKSLTLNDPQQQSLLRLAQEGISVYSPHTAVDATPGGMADWLCDLVTGSIVPRAAAPRSIPKSSSTQHYSEPVYPQPGPVTAASASAVVPHSRSTIHPSPLPVPDGMDAAGMGRLVTFDTPQPLTAVVDRIATGVGLPAGIPVAIPQSCTSTDAVTVRSVGVCPGSGSSVLLRPPPGGQIPDLLFTGELSHHEALAAIERGSSVVALSHSNTERGYLRAVMQQKLTDALRQEWSEEFTVGVSERDRDPYGVMIRQA